MDKVKKKRTLRKSFIYNVLCTFMIVVILSGITIYGCVKFQKWILPDSQEVYLNITKEYDDGTVQKSSMLLDFGEEAKESFLVEKKDKNIIARSGNVQIEQETGEDGEYILKVREYDKNNSDDTVEEEPNEKNVKYSVDKIENSFEALSPKRKAAYTGLSAAMIGLPMIYSIVGILICGFWFYKKKLDRPIKILEAATENISKQDLDFTVSYDGKDEMGALCNSFEEMRQALSENNKQLWNMLEERKMLQASVAHDLRNPIAVIEGYVEYLEINLEQGDISKEKLKNIVTNLSESAKRMERYTDSIRDMNHLEDLEIKREKCGLKSILQEMKEDFSVMAEKHNILLDITDDVCNEEILIDKQVFYRIIENLFTNALRYADKKIKLRFYEDDSQFVVEIKDDGPGFSKEVLEKKNHYFITTDKTGKHMGMGLAIGSILAKKHGGSIEIKNCIEGGAMAVAKISKN